jgi:hypothetical protein
MIYRRMPDHWAAVPMGGNCQAILSNPGAYRREEVALGGRGVIHPSWLSTSSTAVWRSRWIWRRRTGKHLWRRSWIASKPAGAEFREMLHRRHKGTSVTIELLRECTVRSGIDPEGRWVEGPVLTETMPARWKRDRRAHGRPQDLATVMQVASVEGSFTAEAVAQSCNQ